MSDVTTPARSTEADRSVPDADVLDVDANSVSVPARTPAQEGAEVPKPTESTEPGAATGTATTPATEVEVECPGCGLAVVASGTPRATAAWFCPRCDYPLFWVNGSPAPAPSAAARRARRRLPGTGGATVIGAEDCWHCGENNEPGANVCLRCAATLPKPIPPAIDIPVVEILRRERTVVRTVAWPYVTAAALAGASVALAAAGWIYGVL